MTDTSRIAVAGQRVSGGTAVERAIVACAEAKRLEKIGEYQEAYEVLAEYWPDRGQFPILPELPEEVRGELFLRIGALSCWLGSVHQTSGSQELGKDIITQALACFDQLGLPAKVAEARGDLALCYWREGAFDEARIQFSTALKVVPVSEPDLRAILLVRAGIVEVDAHRLNTALAFYNEALPLVDASQDEAIKGAFHFSFGVVFQGLSAPENREDYLDKSLVEYTAASFHFEQAGNVRAQARVENNLGNLFCVIGRYQEAHKHLDRARSLFIELEDVGTVACVDETRARTFLGEGRLVEAERMIKMSVKALERGDQQSVLAEALTTYGVVVARLGFHARAKVLFERAIHVAETIGDPEGVGRAQLSIIEELRTKLPERELVQIYLSAMELLRKAQDPVIGSRLINSAGALLEMLVADGTVAEAEIWEGFSFKDHVKDAERRVISRALRDANGSVTRAARLLGFEHHQSLISLINSRHKELLKERSTVRSRRRNLIVDGGQSVAQGPLTESQARQGILYVGDVVTLGKLMGTGGSYFEGIHVEAFSSLQSAVKGLGDLNYEVVVVGPGFDKAGVIAFIEAVKRSAASGRAQVVVSGVSDWEKELWQSGVAAFVDKGAGVEKLSSAITRLLVKDSE